MRCVVRFILVVVFAMLVFGAGLPIPELPHAGTQADPWILYNTPNVSFAWDAGEADVYGVEFRILNEAGAEVATSTVLRANFIVRSDGDWSAEVRALADPLPNGLYQVMARHFDVSANTSEWCPAMWVRKTWKTLPTPGGCWLYK